MPSLRGNPCGGGAGEPARCPPLLFKPSASYHLFAAPLSLRGNPCGKGFGETNDARSKVQKIAFVSVVLQRLTPLPDNVPKTTRCPRFINSNWSLPAVAPNLPSLRGTSRGGGLGEPARCPRLKELGTIVRKNPLKQAIIPPYFREALRKGFGETNDAHSRV